jgi:ribosomal protein S18 acetylase RimI-like enzyme
LDDVDALIVFWQLAGENDGRPTDSADAVRRLIERDPDALLVAELGGVIVGTVIAGWDGWRAHLYRLAVHPDHRRQGIGRLLLNAAEGRLEALGASRLDAMVLNDNEVGRSAWLARGYRPQAEWSRWVKPVTT